MSESVDPRVIRTRRLLLNALKKIISQEGYESITVQDIVRKAGINRSTFYLHFRDKQEILTELHEEILKELEASFNHEFHYETVLDNFNKHFQPVQSNIDMFEHIAEYSDLYLHMLNEKSFRESVIHILKNEVLRYRKSVWDAIFMANGVLGVILHWLEEGQVESVFEMSMWLTELMLYPLAKLE